MAGRKGPPIEVHPSKCAGCLICELRCSFRFERAFNPVRAAIKVTKSNREDEFTILFTEKCDNCGICARFCPYGALIQERKRSDG
ncbi:MAG: hypothetical protein FJ025_00555 [Chloroflexi bacterium]|nr:hypothetical protein [Chloroflexota bacterium]